MATRPRTRGAALLAALALGAAGCAEREPPGAPVGAPVGAPARAAEAEPARPVDPATVGALVGRVRVDGPLPVRAARGGDLPAGCAHEGAGEPDPASLPVHGVDGGLGGALVSVVDGWRGWRFPPPDPAPVRVEQHGCLFRPRLVAARLGQEVRVGNLDAVTHNVHTYPRLSRPVNRTQAPGGADVVLAFERPEIVPLTCDLHPWMKAHVAVIAHPLFAVTAADGSYRVEGVPPGTYELEVWHEVLGERRATVEVGAREEVRADFLYPREP